jgi:hypothetical protein
VDLPFSLSQGLDEGQRRRKQQNTNKGRAWEISRRGTRTPEGYSLFQLCGKINFVRIINGNDCYMIIRASFVEQGARSCVPRAENTS